MSVCVHLFVCVYVYAHQVIGNAFKGDDCSSPRGLQADKVMMAATFSASSSQFPWIKLVCVCVCVIVCALWAVGKESKSCHGSQIIALGIAGHLHEQHHLWKLLFKISDWGPFNLCYVAFDTFSYQIQCQKSSLLTNKATFVFLGYIVTSHRDNVIFWALSFISDTLMAWCWHEESVRCYKLSFMIDCPWKNRHDGCYISYSSCQLLSLSVHLCEVCADVLQSI